MIDPQQARDTVVPGTMRRIGKQSLVYGAGLLFGKAVAFVMLPVYTRYLTTADYGLLQLIDVSIEVLSIVAGSRLAAGIFHFYHKVPSVRAKNEVLSSAFVVLAGAFLVAGLAAFLAAPVIAQSAFHRPELVGLLRVAAASFTLESLLIVPMSYLQVMEQSGRYVLISVIKLAIQLALNVLFLVVLRLGVLAVLLSTLVANVVIGTFLTVMLVRRVGLRFSRQAAGDIIRFGVPFMGTHLAKFVSTYGDRYVLQAFWGSAAVGVYGLAYQFGFLMATLGDAPYRTVWEPLRFEVAKRADRDAVYARAFIHLNLLQVTIGVGICLFVRDFLRVMATPPFYQAADWVPIIVAAYLLQSWGLFLNTGLYITEQTGLITWATWLGALGAAAGYGALIPPLGSLGAALATLLAFALVFWAVYRLSQRAWPIVYRWGPVVRLVGAAAGVCTLGYLLPPLPLLGSVAVRLALFVAYVCAVWTFRILTDGERRLAQLVVTNPRAGLAALRA